MSAKAILILAMLLLIAVLYLMVGCVRQPLSDTVILTAEECQKVTLEMEKQTEVRNQAPVINAIKGN